MAMNVLRNALPQTCTLCAARCGNALVCGACAAAFPRLHAACPVCGLPTTASSIVNGSLACGACLAQPPPFAATVAPLVYAFPVDRLLQALKYEGRLALAHWAAGELVAAVALDLAQRDRSFHPDCLVALPLAPLRQRQRGFNQAHEIARRVAPRLALPVEDALVRPSGVVAQAALPWEERARNVRGAFAVRGDVRGWRIALVDDVMTTGATLTEAARMLRRAGAARVECWVVARTLAPGNVA